MAVAISLVSCIVASSAFGKPPTAKLTVTGPGITRPIDLTEQDAINANAWAGNFLDRRSGMVDAPTISLPKYTVHFYVDGSTRGEMVLVYVVYYVWDTERDRALIQIPDVSDTWYRLNVATISRCCEGRWFYASPGWGDVIRAALSKGK
jgi:hypothetical protein